MKLITGFFMAWGNFITLPCPYKRWDSSLKNTMLAFLPFIGMVIGLLWLLLFMVVNYLGIPIDLIILIMIFYIFAICGFMHMDGFMDCNDAILSRKPLEEKQRILKDSSVGAFAVVTVCFLLMGWYAAMESIIYNIESVDLIMIPVISRAMAGLWLLTYRPIKHSQYAEDFKEEKRSKYRVSVLVQLTVLMIIIAAMGGTYREYISAASIAVVSFISQAYVRKQLGGMSGDVAGYTICVSELAGVITLAVI